ncbi:MAG TPA: 6-phosphogluconolactonase [Pirellulales bacterium]|nr:6-phosphogluconolactonase [Pirellulales bacterium]
MVAQPEIRIAADRDALALLAAEEFAVRAEQAIAARGAFAVALSGGSTPKELYTLLASDEQPFRRRINWQQVHFFWGDERHVPPDDPQSNYRMTCEAMLSTLPVPAENVHRILAEKSDAAEAAIAYEQTLRDDFHLSPGELPRFDLVLLGLGPEGHTASLFPGNSVARGAGQLVAAPWVEKLNSFRITLTPAVINHAACVVFLVAGADKAEIVAEIIRGPFRPDEWPAQCIRPELTSVVWLLDRAAASKLA